MLHHIIDSQPKPKPLLPSPRCSMFHRARTGLLRLDVSPRLLLFKASFPRSFSSPSRLFPIINLNGHHFTPRPQPPTLTSQAQAISTSTCTPSQLPLHLDIFLTSTTLSNTIHNRHHGQESCSLRRWQYRYVPLLSCHQKSGQSRVRLTRVPRPWLRRLLPAQLGL